MTETIVQSAFHVLGYVLCAVGIWVAIAEHIRWKKQIQQALIEKRRMETALVEKEINRHYEQRFVEEVFNDVRHGGEVAI